MTSITQQDIKSFLKNLFFLGGLILFLGGLYVCIIPGQKEAESLLSSLTFYLIGILFLLWIVFLLRTISKSQVLAYINTTSLVLIISAMSLTTSVFLLHPPEIRLHRDEGTLLGASQSFYTSQSSSVPEEAISSNGKLSIIKTSSPSRPLLFPFLTNLIHRCKGYDLHNAFILNFISLTLLLFLMGILITHHRGIAAGLAIQCAIISHPILWHTAASGIPDVFNTLFFLISALTLIQHLSAPCSRSLILLILSLCLLAHIRYESFIFLPLTIGFLFFLRKISWQHVRTSMPVFIVIAICCLPLLWQRALFTGKQAYYDPTISSLKLEYLIVNLPTLGKFLLSLWPPTPYYFSPILTLGFLTLTITIIIKVRDINKKQLSIDKTIFIWATLCSGVHAVIISSFIGGVIWRYLTSRYFMIEAVFLNILAVLLLFSLVKSFSARWCLTLAFASLLLMQLPLSEDLERIQNRTCHQTLYYREVGGLLNNISRDYSLLVTDYPIEYIIRGWAAIYPKTLNSKTDSIKKAWDENEYKNIYYIRRSKDGNPVKEVAGTWTATLIKTSKIGRRSFVSFYTLKPKETPAL